MKSVGLDMPVDRRGFVCYIAIYNNKEVHFKALPYGAPKPGKSTRNSFESEAHKRTYSVHGIPKWESAAAQPTQISHLHPNSSSIDSLDSLLLVSKLGKSRYG